MSFSEFWSRHRRLTFGLALFLLNASLTFRNIWPTPAVWWATDLSLELGVGLLVVLFVTRNGRVVADPWLSALTATWMLFVFGRYADVTTPALLGRPINLFWDARYAGDVVAMFVRAAPAWAVALVVITTMALLATLYALLRWALGHVVDAASGHVPEARRFVRVSALGLLALYGLERAGGYQGPFFAFATPVTQTYVQQAWLVRDALGSASRALPPSPPLDSDLSLVAGADVMVMFVESYGAVTWQREDFVRRLAAPRKQLTEDVRATGRSAVSAYVESPTYGGSSWLAHISLLSGLEIRDPNANALLMTQQRKTLVTTFAQQGFRTVALMPGLWQAWPEGSFYGFQAMYGGERLEYRGPEFGWWALPDQFTLAKLDELELNTPSRQPLFVFFPTVSTHTPFTPTPRFEPEWPRMLTDHPFDDALIEQLFDEQPDWTDLSPSYGNAIAYAHDVIGGYLRKHTGRDLVLVVIGDHQPPAFVSGEGQPWDVPVHIITNRQEVLDRLKVFGLVPGLSPAGAHLGKMHELLPILLDAFGDRTGSPPALALRGSD